MSKERWRPVFHGAYEVSDRGNVRRLARGNSTSPGRSLKKRLGPGGYLYVQLHFKPHMKTCSVHRLVAKAFVGQQPDSREVNHKNGIKIAVYRDLGVMFGVNKSTIRAAIVGESWSHLEGAVT